MPVLYFGDRTVALAKINVARQDPACVYVDPAMPELPAANQYLLPSHGLSQHLVILRYLSILDM